MNRRAFIVSLSLLPFIGPRLFARQSISLSPSEYVKQGSLEAINVMWTRYRKTYGRDCQPTRLLYGRAQIEDCMNLCWSSSFTREFCMRATKEDYYRASHDHFHDELRAGRGEMFGFKIEHVDADHWCELT